MRVKTNADEVARDAVLGMTEGALMDVANELVRTAKRIQALRPGGGKRRAGAKRAAKGRKSPRRATS